MPESKSEKELSLVDETHEPILEAPHVLAVYASRYGELTLGHMVKINAAYAAQVFDRTCRLGETALIRSLEHLGSIIRG
ncbi:MAG TPA: hypothetical protein VFN56_02665 [Candidatus Saccharimonadales bacterium]|nr:hypothetical protein [Candidatus Saccharimonadales bacterium]